MNQQESNLSQLMQQIIFLLNRENNMQYCDEIIKVLLSCLEITSNNPDLKVLLGLSYEAKGQLEYAENLFSQALSSYKEIYSRDKKVEILHDIAVSFYHLNRASELNTFLPSALEIITDNAYLWMSFCYLYLSLGRFQDSLICVNRSLLLDPEWMDALLMKALILEGLGNYEETISILTNILKKDIPVKFQLDAHHTLAHTLVERRGEGDIAKADYHMKQAVAIDPDYVICLGSIHSETKRYLQAVDIFGNALSEPSSYSRPSFRAELKFYRGQAYWGLEEFERAKEDFTDYESYALQCENFDNVILARNHLVKLELISKGLEDFALEKLSNMEYMLEEHIPSLFTHLNVRQERLYLLDVLRAFKLMKQFLSKEILHIDDLKYLYKVLHQVYISVSKIQYSLPQDQLPLLDYLKKFGIEFSEKDEQVQPFLSPLPVLSTSMVDLCLDTTLCEKLFFIEHNDHFDIFASRGTKLGELNLYSTLELLNNFDIWIVAINNNLSINIAYILGNYKNRKSIICYCDNEYNRQLHLLDGTAQVNSFEEGLLFGEIVLLYEAIKKALVEIPPWPGGVYYSKMPSLSIDLQNPLPIKVRSTLNSGVWTDGE